MNIVHRRKIKNRKKKKKNGVISGPYFPVFGLNTRKYGPEITPYLDNFHTVFVLVRM